jgi:hypothetical protein
LKKAKILFLFLHILLNYQIVYSQDLAGIISSELYSDSDDIINGRKWIYEKKYSGSPLLMEDYWPEADITYKGSVYRGILMNYDLIKGEIIIYHPEKDEQKYVVISKDHLSGFSYTDTVKNINRKFEYIELKGINGKALYENSSTGKLSFYIKPVKKAEAKSADNVQGEYVGFFEYFLGTADGYVSFKNKNQLEDILGKFNPEIKNFIRTNKIKISTKDPFKVIAFLKFYNQLQ